MNKLILIVAMLLSGCMYQSIDTGTIINATVACEKHNGVNRINSWWTGNSSAVCGDAYIVHYVNNEVEKNSK